MKTDDIYNDAEDLKISKGYIKTIGEKIQKKMPKYQFMGLIRINFKDYKKLHTFYKKLGNNNIDMTSFLNLSIKNKIIKLHYFISDNFWVEIDNQKDLNAVKKII